MAISQQHNLLFIHIPKNGGTSIIEHFNMSPHGHFRWDNHPNFNNRFLYKFSVVRNPWDRILSNYTYSKLEKSFWHSSNGTSVYGPHPDYFLLKDKTFSDCIELLYKNPKLFRHEGWSNQSDYIIDNNNNIMVDRIIKFENIDNEIYDMVEKLNLKIQKNLPHINISKKSEFKKFFKKSEVEIVEEIYKKDIINFKYNFNE